MHANTARKSMSLALIAIATAFLKRKAPPAPPSPPPQPPPQAAAVDAEPMSHLVERAKALISTKTDEVEVLRGLLAENEQLRAEVQRLQRQQPGPQQPEMPAAAASYTATGCGAGRSTATHRNPDAASMGSCVRRVYAASAFRMYTVWSAT